MLGKVLDRIDEKLYRAWEANADDLINTFSEGLARIQFQKPMPEEIQKIQKSLLELKKSDTISREAKLALLKNINDQLEILATKKQFDNVEISNFIFQSRRTFKYLTRILYTEYNKYAEAVLNPSTKEKPEEPQGKIEHKIMGKAARGIVTHIMDTYEKEIRVLYHANVDKFKKQGSLTCAAPKDKIPSSAKPSVLHQKMGKENYRSAESTIEINSPDDVSKYYSEQIYAMSFDAYYMQVAKLYDAKTKIEKLAASGDPDEFESNRKKLFDEAGLSELNTKAGLEYINNIAKILGFDNAKDLYRNYQSLDTPEGFAIFKEIKSEFIAHADRDIPDADDPLENLKREIAKENKRIKSKSNKEGKTPQCDTYANLINFNANEIIWIIGFAQRGKNICELLADDLFNAKHFSEEKMGYFQRKFLDYLGVGLKAALNKFDFKQYIDSILFKVFGDIKSDTGLLLENLDENTLALNNQWAKKVNARIEDKARDEIISKGSEAGLEGNKLIDEYILAMQDYKREFKNYNLASDLDKESAEYKSKKFAFKEAEAKFTNYKDAYSISADSNILMLDETNIDAHIGQREKKIKIISSDYEKKVKELGELHQALKNEQNKRNKSVGGFFAKIMDTVSPFGYKTKSFKEMQSIQQKIDQAYRELEPVGLAMNIHMDLLIRARKHKGMLEQLKQTAADTHSKEISKLINTYNASYEQLRSDFAAKSSPKQAQEIHEHQQDFSRIEFQLMHALRLLSDKLNNKNSLDQYKSMSLEDTLSFLNEIEMLEIQNNSIYPVITGKVQPNPAIASQIENLKKLLQNMIKEKRHIAQEKRLAQHKEAVSQAFKEFSIDKLLDPFEFIESLNEVKLSDLTQESQAALYKHVVKAATDLLANNPDISIKTLEAIFSRLQTNQYLVAQVSKGENLKQELEHCYQQLIEKVSKRISAEHQKIGKLQVIDLKKKLSDLSQELLYLKSSHDDASKKSSELARKIGSWWDNPFGSLTEQMLLQAKSNEHATKELFNLYQEQYLGCLEAYAQKAIPLFEAFDYELLVQHIEQLQNTLVQLQEHGVDNKKIVSELNTLIEAAQKAESTHLRHADQDFQSELENLEGQIYELEKVSDLIHKKINQQAEIDPRTMQEYQSLIIRLNQYTAKLDQNSKDINHKNAVLEEKYKALGYTPMEDILHRSVMSEKLARLKINILNNRKQNEKLFNFYDTIAQGKDIVLDDISDKQTLGKGLVMALKNRNHQAVTSLLSPITKGQIDSYELGSALILSAKMGNIDALKKILSYKSELIFTPEQLNQAFRAAIRNQDHDIASFIVFNTDFSPDKETLDAVFEHSKSESTLSGIDRGWAQLISDVDGAKLEDIRKWFTLLKQLSESLKDEAEMLKRKATQLDIENPAQLAQIKEDINFLLNKIGKITELNAKSAKLIEHVKFDTPTRKEQHLGKWSAEIENSLGVYHKLLVDILNPAPSIISPPHTLLDDIVDEKNKHDVIVQDKVAHRLSTKGVIAPATIRDDTTVLLQTTPIVQIDTTIETKTELANVQEQLDKLLDTDLTSPQSLHKLGSLLASLKHLADGSESYKTDIYIQKAIYKLAKENKDHALILLLGHVDAEKLNEISANALTQAIEAGSRQAAIILMQKNSFKGHENEILEIILDILNEKESGKFTAKHASAQDMLFELLTHANVNIIDPETSKPDERIIKALQASLPADNTSYPAVTRSWGLKDNDKPKLDALRNAYLYADQAYSKLLMSTFINVQKILEADPSELSEIEINLLDQQLKLIENTYQRQLDLLKNVTSVYTNVLKEVPFDNTGRKEGYVTQWEEALKASVEKTTNSMKSNVLDARKVITAAREILSQKEVKQNQEPKQATKRQSVLLSKGHKRKTEKTDKTSAEDRAVQRKSFKPGDQGSP